MTDTAATTPTRFALIASDKPETIARYLPRNYEVVDRGPAAHTDTLVRGQDNAGWTLDGYVLPRLASGMYFGREVTAAEAAELLGLTEDVV